MATKRQYGGVSGGEAALGGLAGGIADWLKRSQADDDEQRKQALALEKLNATQDAEYQRQKKLADDAHLNALSQLLASHPDLAQRMKENGQTPPGLDLTPFLPTGQDAAQGELKTINSADTLSKLPTEQEAVATMRANGAPADPYFGPNLPTPMNVNGLNVSRVAMPIRDQGETPSATEGVIRSLQARRGSLEAQQQMAHREEAGKVPGYDRLSGEMRQNIPGVEPIITRPSPIQQGQDQKAVLLNSTLSNDVIGQEAKKAGAVQSASTAAEINTRNQLLPILTKTEQELAKARAAGKPTTGSGNTTDSIAEQMINMSNDLNTVSVPKGSTFQSYLAGANVAGLSAKQWLEKQFHTNPKAQQLDQLQQGFVTLFARLMGQAANSISDKDAKSIMAILPHRGQSVEENEATNANFRILLQKAHQIGDSLGDIPQGDPAAAQAEMDRRMGILMGGGAGPDVPGNEIHLDINGDPIKGGGGL